MVWKCLNCWAACHSRLLTDNQCVVLKYLTTCVVFISLALYFTQSSFFESHLRLSPPARSASQIAKTTYPYRPITSTAQCTHTVSQPQIEWNFLVLTRLIADAESQVEGGEPRHRPRRRLHGEGAFVGVQQGEQRRHVRQPATGTSAQITHTSEYQIK